jgi:HlyD family secretion protein
MLPAFTFRFRIEMLAALSVLSACGRDEEPEAYGNFEATEVVISAESAGRLLWFSPEDGQKLAAGDLVGVVDTVALALERAQLMAQQSSSTSRAREVAGQLGVLEAQREIAERVYQRTRRLHASQAATSQQLDQAEREFRTITEQITMTRAQRQTATQDIAGSAARVAQIEERIERSRITNPRPGTVLTSYAQAGEYVQQGQPLYKLANLDSMELRAYITESQLALVRIGQHVAVTIDAGSDARRTLEGTVTWVSAAAEFTPTPIQTRDERADLVYAIKIRVPNPDGVLKIGMPADVRFSAQDSSAR